MTTDNEPSLISKFFAILMIAAGALFAITGGLCGIASIYGALITSTSELTVTTPDGVTTTIPNGGAGFYGLYSGLTMSAIGFAVAWGGVVMVRAALRRFRENAQGSNRDH